MIAAAGWFGWRRFGRVAVAGASMRPTLEPGDRLLVHRTRRIQPGDLAVLADPRVPDRPVVKRVAAIGDGDVTVLGDNPAASTDSRHYGPVPVELVEGRAWYRYTPPDRAGRLPRARGGRTGVKRRPTGYSAAGSARNGA